MPDYAKMYAILCAAASDAIDLIADGKSESAVKLLQSALTSAEDLYINAEDTREKTKAIDFNSVMC